MQQLCGVAAVVCFAESIFVHGNVPSPILFATLLGVTQLVFTIVSTFVVDHLGRKLLLMLSCSGVSIALAALGCYFYALENYDSISLPWLPIVCLVFFMMMFAIGLGPVTWLLLGEILGPDIKKVAFGLASGALLTTGSLIIYSFHPLINVITIAGTFWMFCCIAIVSTIYTIFFVPETKNKTLMQIQDELSGTVKEPKNVEPI